MKTKKCYLVSHYRVFFNELPFLVENDKTFMDPSGNDYYSSVYEDKSVLDDDNVVIRGPFSRSTMDINEVSEKQIGQYCLDIIKFIQASNLNKTHTNSFLKLVNRISANKALPQNEKQLWETLDIQFRYKSFAYCTNCMKRLLKFSDQCDACCKTYCNVNSELVIFPIETELHAVIEMNADFVKGYHPHDICDVIYGELFCLT